MSLISVHGMATNAVNLVEAYRHLNITDPDIPDGDIVVAFYEYVDEGKRHNYISDRTQWATNALKTIANSRQSQLLAFILTIIPHLTKENVALLATPTSSASLLQSTNRVLEHQEGGDSYTAVPLASNSVQFPSAPVAPTSSIALTCLGSQPIVALISTSPNDLSETFQNKTFTTGWNSSSASAYEPSNISDSDGSHSEDTDVPEEIGGRFWDGTIFRCEDCCTPLEAGQCPNGHEMDSCYSCHKDFTPSICAAYCEDCHAARGSPCEDCVILDEEEDEDEEEIGKNRMIWDNNDWVWRCTICMWEIEADGENQGYCQCSAESIVAPVRLSLLYGIKLNQLRIWIYPLHSSDQGLSFYITLTTSLQIQTAQENRSIPKRTAEMNPALMIIMMTMKI